MYDGWRVTCFSRHVEIRIRHLKALSRFFAVLRVFFFPETQPFMLRALSLLSFFLLSSVAAAEPSQLATARELVATVFAGAAAGPDYIDDAGTAARLFAPSHLHGDGGRLYFTDGQKVRQLDISSGEVTTLAGSDEFGFIDGVASAARFKAPGGLWRIGAFLYIADSENSAIRGLNLATLEVTTFVDRLAVRSLWSDAATLYTIGCGGNCLYTVDVTTRIATMVAGDGFSGANDGLGTNARFNSISGIWGDTNYVYLIDPLRFRTFDLIGVMAPTYTQAAKKGSSRSIFQQETTPFLLRIN